MRLFTKHKALLKFLLPSLLGILLFLTPVSINNTTTIPFAIFTNWIQHILGFILLDVVVWTAVAGMLMSLYYLIAKPDWEASHPALHAIAATNLAWFTLRIAGASIGIMVLYGIGPEIFRLNDTGIAMFKDIGIPFLVTMIPACFLMPLLTDFGIMEFFGTFVAPLFKYLFRLPGRAAVDASASFISISSVGILITARQYQLGHYSAREAAAIACNFSVVSLPFALVIAKTAKVDQLFFTWYLTSILACFVCAIISVRLPPLSKIPDSYLTSNPPDKQNNPPTSHSLLQRSTKRAITQAAQTPAFTHLLASSNRMFLGMVFGVLGPSLALATLTAILTFHTPIITNLAWPINYLLSALGVQQAASIAPGFIIGFLDQFIPAVIAGGIENESFRFVLAGLSLCQLIFMSVSGIVILQSSIPINIYQLAQIFILRTLIVTPIFILVASTL